MLQFTRFPAAARVGMNINAARSFASSGVMMAKKQPVHPNSPPKGPASAYTLFVKDWFAENKEKHASSEQKLNLGALASQLGEAWSQLAESAKSTYSATAKDLKTSYDKEYRTWYEGLTPETIKEMEKITGKKLSPPGGKKKYRAEKNAEAGGPPRPLTPFFEFMKSFREGGDVAGLNIREQAKKGGEKWKSMSDSEKKPYQDISAEKKAKYESWKSSQN